MNSDYVETRNEELMKVIQSSADESDRGLTLILAAHIEDCLRRILESVLLNTKELKELFDGPYAPFGSLSGKTQAAFLLGLITRDEKERIDAVRRVRNVFAHHWNASFDHPEVVKVCNKPAVNSGRMEIRDEFLHVALNTIPALLYRDRQVSAWSRPELTQEMVNGWHRR